MGRKKRSTPMRRVNYFLTVEQIERIEALSTRTGLDRSAIIRLAIDAYLLKQEKVYAKIGGQLIEVAFLKAPEKKAQPPKKTGKRKAKT